MYLKHIKWDFSKKNCPKIWYYLKLFKNFIKITFKIFLLDNKELKIME